MPVQLKKKKAASKLLSPMLNFQSHWRPVCRNFGAQKTKGRGETLFSSFVVLGGVRGLWGLRFSLQVALGQNAEKAVRTRTITMHVG